MDALFLSRRAQTARSVLSALRISDTTARRERGSAEPSFTRGLRALLQLRHDEELASQPLDAIFEPLLEIVRSETTSGMVTDAALNSIVTLVTGSQWWDSR